MIGIIGATGNVGSEIVEILGSQSEEIVALSRSERPKDGQILWRKADLWNPEQLKEALLGVEMVYFMIPLDPSWSDFYGKIQSAIDVFLSVAKELGVKRVVSLSSLGAHRKESIGMFHMARIIEERLSGQSFEVTFVRPAEFMENWRHSVDAVKFGGVLPNYHLPPERKFHQVSVKDVASVCAEAIKGDRNERIIHITGPELYSAEDARKAFAEKFQRPVEFATPPRETWDSEFQKYGMSSTYAKELAELYDAINAGLIGVEDNCGTTVKGGISLKESINRF